MKILTKQGFTLLEILIVLAIIGILTSIVLSSFQSVRQMAYLVKAKKEFKSVVESLEQYYQSYGGYPEDVVRDIPPGLEEYLAPGIWPDAAWPDSVFDWDNWSPGSLSHEPKEQIYQISVRFCPIGEPDKCRFPKTTWAEDFDINSSVYYCIEGPCRSHSSRPVDHPGYCINCP
ncbi:MAG: type II secretion system protein [Candidatus Paceibacterota bacterium]